MSYILIFIQNNANKIIFILGLAIATFIVWNASVLSSKKSKIEEKLVSREKKYHADLIKKELSEEEEKELTYSPDKIRLLVTDFNNTCVVHDMLVQFIPLFPLFGILGTVAGLMLEVQSGDIASMMRSLDTALTSTFWGLVFAIGLKIIDALFPSRIINAVDIMIDDFEKKLSIAEMFQNIKNK